MVFEKKKNIKCLSQKKKFNGAKKNILSEMK